MIINEMTKTEINALLSRASIGRLACARDDHPYIVPLRFAYHSVFLYSFTTVGRKVEWMRNNPHVCVAFDEIDATNRWQSVIVNGLYEELSSDPSHVDARATAHHLLSASAEWWQPGYAKTVIRESERPLEPIFFRISILETSGHKAVKTSS